MSARAATFIPVAFQSALIPRRDNFFSSSSCLRGNSIISWRGNFRFRLSLLYNMRVKNLRGRSDIFIRVSG